MATNTVQARVKLSLADILEGIEQLSTAEKFIVAATLKRIGLYEMQPIPYVVKLEPGKSFEQTLRERGFNGTNWARVDEIVAAFNAEPMEIPIEEQLKYLD